MQENVLLGFAPLVSGRVTMGARRIFSRGGQIRGSGDESLPAGSQWVWGKAPKSRRKIVKIMHCNY